MQRSFIYMENSFYSTLSLSLSGWLLAVSQRRPLNMTLTGHSSKGPVGSRTEACCTGKRIYANHLPGQELERMYECNRP